MNVQQQAAAGLLREREVLELVPISRSTWLRMVERGEAPKPLKLGARAVVYRAADVQAFIASLVEARDAA